MSQSTNQPSSTIAAAPLTGEQAIKTLQDIAAKMTTQLSLHGPAFKTVDKLHSTTILEQVEEAVKLANDIVATEDELKQLAQLKETVERDRKALLAKVRGFDRKFGGYYGTGF